ncbi:macrophage migration inhibitory factor (MIF) domain-containing protein [Ditylenchus destructor]|nr:macrophage migration inhibitory factor (MIF) domain-containing protein [Ditylenchus destructor]
MPIVTVATNLPAAKFSLDFRTEFVKFCEDIFDRKGLIILHLQSDADIGYGNVEDFAEQTPVVMITVEVIRSLTEDENSLRIKLISDYINKILDVSQDRIVIVFKPLQAQNVGYDGKLLSQHEKKSKQLEKEIQNEKN